MPQGDGARGKAKGRRRKKKGSAASHAVGEALSPNELRAMIVVNPVAGNGEVLEVWEELQETLRDLGLDFDYRITERRGHAVEIAADATGKGYGIVGAVGGDGTVFEIVNGIMSVDGDKRPALGVIPMGRCSDLCRTLDIPRDWRTAASLLVSGRRRLIDLGRMEYEEDGKAGTSYFANIAGLGFDGEVTERANEMPEKLSKVVGGIGTHLLSLLITYARYREKDIELHVDDRMYRVLATTVVVANCRFFGGKMCVAPDAVCDDGLFDVVVIGAGFGPPAVDLPADSQPPSHSRLERSLARARMAKNVPKIYRGTHVEDDSVMTVRGRKVRVVSDDRLVLQADGEVIGQAPFVAEVLPRSLEIIA